MGNVHNLMVSTFKDPAFWISLNTEFIKVFKKYIDNIAALGFNMLMLYTEDVYEMPEYPRFGYMRGRYTKDEINDFVSGPGFTAWWLMNNLEGWG